VDYRIEGCDLRSVILFQTECALWKWTTPVNRGSADIIPRPIARHTVESVSGNPSLSSIMFRYSAICVIFVCGLPNGKNWLQLEYFLSLCDIPTPMMMMLVVVGRWLLLNDASYASLAAILNKYMLSRVSDNGTIVVLWRRSVLGAILVLLYTLDIHMHVIYNNPVYHI